MNLYEQHRYKIGTGDALQWKSFTPLGWLIRLFAKPDESKLDIPEYNVNHTSLAITFSEYDQDRRYTTEALEHGIDLNMLSRRLQEYRGKVYWLPLKLKYNHCRRDIGKIALSHMGIGYDYKALVKQIYSRVRPDKKSLYCSEHYFIAVSGGLRLHGINNLNDIVKAPRPCDIPDLGIFAKAVRIK